MKYLKAVIIMLIACRAYGQQCDCEKEFTYIQRFMEMNYAGFKDKVRPENEKQYIDFTSNLKAMALKSGNSNYCFYYINKWLKYFYDKHIQTVPKNGDYQPVIESITLSPSDIEALRKKTLSEIEGVYKSESGSYEVALIKNENVVRTYVAVVIKTSAKGWSPGQVKFELIAPKLEKYEGIVYYKDHSMHLENFGYTNGILQSEEFTTYIKEGASLPKETIKEPFKEENSNKYTFYKSIDDSTSYVRIKTFDDHFAKEIKSVIDKNLSAITKKPNLIIDLRFNGGGSDFTYQSLLPLIYTNPIRTIGADIYSTPENIKSWQRIIDENKGLPKEVTNSILDVINKMKEKPNQFISLGSDQTDTIKTSYQYPQKVIIMIDDGCASSCEEFLLAARQSNKVLFVGKPTAGILDYSNVRLVDFSCLNYRLGYCTSRSRRIPFDAIDNSGIQPDIPMAYDGDWLSQIKALLSPDEKEKLLAEYAKKQKLIEKKLDGK